MLLFYDITIDRNGIRFSFKEMCENVKMQKQCFKIFMLHFTLLFVSVPNTYNI